MKRRLLLTAFASSLFLVAAAESAHAQRPGRWGGGYYGPQQSGYGYGYGVYQRPYYGNYGSYYRPDIGGSYTYPDGGYRRGSPYRSLYGVTPYYNQIEYGIPADSSAAVPSIGRSQSFYSARDSEGNFLRFHVVVPKPDAQLWIDDTLTKQVGTERDFISPPVEPDKNYLYTFRAKWSENGREVNRDKQVRVKVGQSALVRFD